MNHQPEDPETRLCSPDEARDSVQRFVALHFEKTDHEHARFTIPVDFYRDDDVLLMKFIDHAEDIRTRIVAAEALLRECRDPVAYAASNAPELQSLVDELDAALAEGGKR